VGGGSVGGFESSLKKNLRTACQGFFIAIYHWIIYFDIN
jgi:hypothetical protein